ncbi:MAG: hypothetical protein QGF59_03820, partial [Pirellulaceae bacterium]|nr:hypothetical protein [Pirellulaceae bacterium]
SPVLLGSSSQKPVRRTAILQNARGVLAFRHDDWKLRYRKAPQWSGRNAELPKANPELYDLATDPSETTNLARKHPERVRKMQELLSDLLNEGRSR